MIQSNIFCCFIWSINFHVSYIIKILFFSSQSSIYVHWFILSAEDVADFYLFIRDQNNTLYYSKEVAYNLRFLTIAIDDNFKASLQSGGKHDVCIQAKTSNGFARKWFDGQCQSVPSNFESWPKKLNIDKRRLSRKKVKYSWFSNNVLGLVSDSILITLCIFLGVCFRRLSDLDLWLFLKLF